MEQSLERALEKVSERLLERESGMVLETELERVREEFWFPLGCRNRLLETSFLFLDPGNHRSENRRCFESSWLIGCGWYLYVDDCGPDCEWKDPLQRILLGSFREFEM